MNNLYIHPGQRPNKSRRPARKLAAAAKERRLPKMHWTWVRRHRDLEVLFQARFGSTLPNNAAGRHAAKTLAQHYMRLHFDAERITRANFRIWAPWLTEHQIARMLSDPVVKAPSAVQLGRDFRITANEVANLRLQSVCAIEVTQENDRNRQACRRQRTGAVTGKRGRPSLGLSPAEKKARENAQAAERMRRKRLRENAHASSYIRETRRDEFSVTQTPHDDRRAPKRDGAAHWSEIESEIVHYRDDAMASPLALVTQSSGRGPGRAVGALQPGGLP